MTNDLKTVLAETLAETKQGVGKAVEWVMAQMPELCEQYLRIEMVKACSAAILLTLAAAVLTWICIRVIKWAIKHGGVKDHPECMMLMFPGAAAVAFVIYAYGHAMTAATIAIAPKVYLVEFAAKLIK